MITPKKKVIMNHELAKALMNAGMEHFDVGGTVASGSPGGATAAPNTITATGTNNPGASGFLNTYSPGNAMYGSTIDGQYIQGPGQQLQGIAESFTPQDTFQAQLAPITTYDYTNPLNQAINGVQGGAPTNQNILAEQQDLQNQQQSFAKQLQLQTEGGGPNPAASALSQQTGANNSAQAALMAGQRGASGNAGLLVRQIAQQGSANEQNAIGQEAIQRQEQQLNAQQALMQQQQAIGQTQSQMQQANLGEQGQQNTYLGNVLGSQNAQNNAIISNYNQAQGINAKTAQENAAANQKTTGSFVNSASSLLSMLYEGGEVKHPHLHEMAKIYHPEKLKAQNFTKGGTVPGKPLVNHNSPKNDVQLALLTPKEAVLPLSVTQSKNAPEKAKEFMKSLQSHSSEKEHQEKQKNDLHRVLKKRKGTMSDRLNRLEKLCYGGMSA